MRRFVEGILCGYQVVDSLTAGLGEVPEWSKGAVSKTVVAVKVTVGSNPTLSAITNDADRER